MPLAPAAIVPKTANVIIGAVVAALLVVPVVLLHRRHRAPRLGAALLALLAIAAVTPPITGLGTPSQEEIQQYIATQIAIGRPIDFSDGDLWLLPWDDSDLLLLTIAFLAAAALLLALGRTVQHQGRPEPLPLRWRWPLVMWGVALVLVSIPRAMYLAATLTDGPAQQSIMAIDLGCFGGLAEILFPATAFLSLIPPPIVVTLGFALWALLARTGHRPLGRVVGWLTVVPLVAGDMLTNWMPVLGCAMSPEDQAGPVTLPWVLYTLLPVVLIVLAVRVRRPVGSGGRALALPEQG